MSEEHFLESLTWPEVEARIKAGVDAVLIPIGSTEQHGRHMPLDTDCFIARSLSERAAEQAASEGVNLLVAPTLNVTLSCERNGPEGTQPEPGHEMLASGPFCSCYHMQFPGTLRLSVSTFLQVFREVCESLAQHGFQNLIAVNGHGGNIAALTVAINQVMETSQRRVFLVQWWDMAADVLASVEGSMIHAEEAETSIALALGHRVLMEEATRAAFDRGQAVKDRGMAWTSLGKYGMRHSGPGVVVPMDMLRDITESGVVGDATRARKETGERVVAAMIPRIVQVAREMAGRES